MDKKMVRSIMREIMTISRCVVYIRDVQFKQFGISKGQHAFLTRVYENPGINQEELSNMLKIDKTTVAKALKKLEEKDFIKRIHSEEDNRQWLLYPTEKLLSIYDDIEELILSTSCNAVKGLTEEETETLLPLLTKITESVNIDWHKMKSGDTDFK